MSARFELVVMPSGAPFLAAATLYRLTAYVLASWERDRRPEHAHAEWAREIDDTRSNLGIPSVFA